MMSPQLPFEYDDVEQIDFEANKFYFTGNFNYGKKERCKESTETQGGTTHQNVCKDTDYLVVGAKGNKNYAHGNYGRQIEHARELKAKGCPIAIISEDAWLRSLTALISNAS